MSSASKIIERLEEMRRAKEQVSEELEDAVYEKEMEILKAYNPSKDA